MRIGAHVPEEPLRARFATTCAMFNREINWRTLREYERRNTLSYSISTASVQPLQRRIGKTSGAVVVDWSDLSVRCWPLVIVKSVK